MIRVIGDYGIDASDKCYAVGRISKLKEKKDGKYTGEEKEYLINPSYVTTFTGALKCIRKDMQRETIKSIDGDLKAAIEAIQKCDERFEQMIAGIDA